mmetsp:Transcript_5180/g.8384  ORF Transcript_5180/g.8384 Transcript_5180/m.8384 type:complete len:276 (-) Transcript_5180:152-979(-)
MVQLRCILNGLCSLIHYVLLELAAGIVTVTDFIQATTKDWYQRLKDQSTVSTIKPEIQTNTEWAVPCLQREFVATEVKSSLFPERYEVYLLNILAEDEAENLVQMAEKVGFGYTNYPKLYRGNLRIITFDESLAVALWPRVKDLVPSTLLEDGKQFRAIGLNKCWRLAKYLPGDQFQAHVDTFFKSATMQAGDAFVKSMFTVNIYMNSQFAGGETKFHFDDESISVSPQTGLCVIFRQPPSQRYSHEGIVVRSGVKYLFRSDVMYEAVCDEKQKR